MNRISVQQSFDSAYASYDQAAVVQRRACDETLALVKQQRQQFTTVVDLACGTGESTIKLLEAVEYQKCLAVDFAPKLLQRCREKLSGYGYTSSPRDYTSSPRGLTTGAILVDPVVKPRDDDKRPRDDDKRPRDDDKRPRDNSAFVLADMEKIPFAPASIDLMLCNMGLQWVGDITATLRAFSDALLPGALFAFSVPVDGNFPELKSEYKLPLLNQKALEANLAAANFTVLVSKSYHDQQVFSSPLAALRSIRHIGANCGGKAKGQQRAGLSRAHLQEMFIHPNNCNLTYAVACIIARKDNQ